MYQHGVHNSPSGNPSNRMDVGQGVYLPLLFLKEIGLRSLRKHGVGVGMGTVRLRKLHSLWATVRGFFCLFVGFVRHTCMEHGSNSTLSIGKGGVSH